MFPTIHLPVTKTWTSSENPDFTVGQIVQEGGNIYKFVQNGASGASAVGRPAYAMAGGEGVVGKHADALNNAIAEGAYVSEIPASGYGFILVKGYYASLYSSAATLAAGSAIHPSSDAWVAATIGNDHVHGLTKVVFAANVGPGVLNCVS